MSKYKLKNEYKNILKEFRVNVENDNFYYDYEVSGNLENIDFEKFEFKNKDGSFVPSTLERIIPKKSEMKTQERGAGKFNFQNLSQKAKALLNNIDPKRLGSGVQILVLKAIDNIIVSDKRAYGFIRREANLNDKIKVVFEVIKSRLSREEEVITEVLKDICTDKTTGYNDKEFQAIKTFMLNFNSSEYNNIYESLTTGKNKKINATVEKYFVTKAKSQGQFKEANLLMSLIADAYIGDGPNALSLFLRGLKTQRANNPNTLLGIRKDYSVDKIKSALEELNNTSLIEINDLAPGYRKGRGEFLIHMLFNTTNACLSKEPDAIFKKGGKRFSIKSSASTARTGENMSTEIREATDALLNFIDLNAKVGLSSLSYSEIPDKLATKTEIPAVSLENLYKNLKIAIVLEHEADGLIIHKKDHKMQLLEKRDLVPDNIILTGMKNNRWSFTVQDTSTTKKEFELAMRKLINDEKQKKQEEAEALVDAYEFSHLPKIYPESISRSKKKVLKEVYSNLFKKKLIKEGGKAGHMMHPYENLHLKISEMKEMISDFQEPFKISEKVDGGNLHFTVNPATGQILFSRNKKDMTHEETLEKFGPGHGAEIMFTDGSNSVYNAVKAALSRSDINQIFGKSPEGGKTYINFEIMHPKKVIQIRYDMKYIVFHAIVDFDINGEKVYSSPDDPRLMLLIDKLKPYFATQDNDFNLGSNFKVTLNKLSPEDVEELNLEIDKVTSKLGLNDNMTIADGVKHEIKKLLDQNNLTEILSDEKVEMIYNFITDESSGITGNQIKKDLGKETKKMLSSLGLTSKTKAYGIIKKVTKEFRKLFLLLGIKLLHNVQSRYMSKEAGALNVDELRRLLTAALEDYDNLVNNPNPSEFETKLINKMSLHVSNIRDYGIENAISSPVEGGVFVGKDGNTYKVTGGYGPLNQILGTAFFNMDYMPAFKAERKLQGRD